MADEKINISGKYQRGVNLPTEHSSNEVGAGATFDVVQSINAEV
jgi:hypothetical protein